DGIRDRNVTGVQTCALPIYVEGSFIGELKNVTVRQALGLILPPLGLDYGVDGNVIRVFKRVSETRIFDINFTATERTGTSTVVEIGRASCRERVYVSGVRGA